VHCAESKSLGWTYDEAAKVFRINNAAAARKTEVDIGDLEQLTAQMVALT
jgi:hypothetical protein